MTGPRNPLGDGTGYEYLTPGDGAERLTAALGGRQLQPRDTPPPFPVRRAETDARLADVVSQLKGET